MDASLVQNFIDKQHAPEDFKFVVLEIIKQANNKGVDTHRVLLQQETFLIFKL